MEDIEIQIADYFEGQAITKSNGEYYKLRDWIAQVVREALAERTEQCAKICNEAFGYGQAKYGIDGMPALDLLEQVENKIRALNQPENKS